MQTGRSTCLPCRDGPPLREAGRTQCDRCLSSVIVPGPLSEEKVIGSQKTNEPAAVGRGRGRTSNL